MKMPDSQLPATLRNISKEEFYDIDGARRIIVHEPQFTHRYTILETEKVGHYGLAWCSSLVEPEFQINADGNILWIGIDRQVVAIDLTDGRIRFSFPLHGNFLKFTLQDDFVFIISDGAVMVLNSDFTFRSEIPMFGLPLDVEREGDTYYMIVEGGEREKLIQVLR
jgi:hypothetical protein